MVADDPESFADLDGHQQNASPGNPPGTNNGPSCAGTGAGASSSPAVNGCARQPANTVTTWSSSPNIFAQTLTVTRTDTTTTTASDGTATTTVSKTTVTFSTAQDHVGDVVNANQHVDMTRKAADGTITPVASTGPFGQHITAEAAKQAFGENAFKAAQAASMPGQAEFFNRAVRNDTSGWLHAAVGVGLLALPVGEGYHLGKAFFDVGLATYDLVSGVREVRHPE
jgi:hypothetical protein